MFATLPSKAPLAAAALVLSGCLSYGDPNLAEPTRLAALDVGTTTIDDVHQSFGQPHQVQENPDGRTWDYYGVSTRISPLGLIPYAGFVVGGDHVTYDGLRLSFDENDRLENYVEIPEEKHYQLTLVTVGDAFTRSYGVRSIRAEMERLGLPFENKAARNVTAAIDRYVD
ncbi:MAG: hypothetical protein AAGH41_05695 [Pseudomonadota bacterium]